MKAIVRRLGITGSAGVAVLAVTAGTAAAYWVTTGSGSATAVAGSAQNPTTSTAVTPTSLLLPGGSADVAVKINNPNSYPVRVTAVTGNGTITASGGVGSCSTSSITFTNQTPSSGNTIPANGTVTLTFTNAISMTTNADQGCQNATFTIPVSITISS